MMTNEWRLTQPALDRLLVRLDDDQEAAARKYEDTRRALIKFFASRGCHTPEEQTDRTIDRVAKKIEEGVELCLHEPAMYFYGVARHVLLEYYRRHSASLGPSTFGSDDAETRHRRYECMGRCLDALPSENRTLLIDYYSAEKRIREHVRRGLAARMGITLNTLRLRVHRLREQLVRSVNACMEMR